MKIETIIAKQGGIETGRRTINKFPETFQEVIDSNDVQNFGNDAQRYLDWRYGCKVRIQGDLRPSPTSEERKAQQREAFAHEEGFDSFAEMKEAVKAAKAAKLAELAESEGSEESE